MERRKFLGYTAAAGAAYMLHPFESFALAPGAKKIKLAQVGTGHRGSGFWGKELLAKDRVGKITSVDFHWYLNVYHGADYFRRWHGRIAKSGSLLVHKATHHFDLMNWWLNSEPVEVTAYGSLDHYGKNNEFRG